jgi:hypothetical protein
VGRGDVPIQRMHFCVILPDVRCPSTRPTVRVRVSVPGT